MATFFSYAFRPLFLLATVYAIVIVPYWGAAWLGAHSLPSLLGTPSAWHAHEMIFGFAGAAVGGFALTAVATWTKRPPVSGVPLALLSLLWLTARVLFFASAPDFLAFAAAADLAFGVLLFALMFREVVGARNRRNYKVLFVLGLLPMADAVFFYGVARGEPWTMNALVVALWLLVLLINLIGGRVIPNFTRNWMMRRFQADGRPPSRLPPSFDRFDLACSALLVAFAILDVMQPAGFVVPVLGLVTAGVLAVRVFRWRCAATLSEPLVWVLHLAYAWIPVGLVLLSVARLGIVPRSAGIHALSSGAIATMILAIAGRAALGHTGRVLEGHPLLTASYAFVTAAAVFRVAATVGPGARILLMLSVTAWALGFLCFLWRYAPILSGPVETGGGRRRLPTA